MAQNAASTGADFRASGEYMLGLEKGLATIEAFGASHPRLTLSEAAALTGVTRASARRCLLTLCALGYAEYDGKYFRLAPRSLRLGNAYLTSAALPKIVQPVLETLAERTHESASVAILDHADVVFIARSTVRRSLSVGVGVGTRIPAYCAATGRVMLADLPDAAVKELLRAAPLRELTPRTITRLPALMQAIAQARSRGYAISDQEIELGVRSIAVPIRDSRGAVVGAMSLAVQASRMSCEEMAERLLPALEGARRTLSTAL
jgi:IclR family pca regulon transcriptional regulator